jgi:uncharacterized protein YndB with AHSA1/START domain
MIIGNIPNLFQIRRKNMNQGKKQFAEAGMLIRKPVEQVFEAFINPEITTSFWFLKAPDD